MPNGELVNRTSRRGHKYTHITVGQSADGVCYLLRWHRSIEAGERFARECANAWATDSRIMLIATGSNDIELELLGTNTRRRRQHTTDASAAAKKQAVLERGVKRLERELQAAEAELEGSDLDVAEHGADYRRGNLEHYADTNDVTTGEGREQDARLVDIITRQLEAARAKLQAHVDEMTVYELDDSDRGDGIVVDRAAAEVYEAELATARVDDAERELILAGAAYHRVANWGDGVARVERKTRGHDGRYLSTGDYLTDIEPVGVVEAIVEMLNTAAVEQLAASRS
jgi:hypothetical protein